MMFRDRTHAGTLLAAQRARHAYIRPVILALPRGGVPVGAEVARALSAPLDLLLVRKIGHPLHPELALGAIVDGDHPELVINPDVGGVELDYAAYLETAKSEALAEIERRRQLYLGGRNPVDVAHGTAVVVDDGIATGATVRAALKALRHRHPRRIVLAVPVAPADTLDALRLEVDDVVCLDTPSPFIAVGQFYQDFRQVTDADVIRLLRTAEEAAGSMSRT
jgi:putative phosphoribosyl transferase